MFHNGKLINNIEILKDHIMEGREIEIKLMNKLDIDELYPKEEEHD